MVDTETEEVLFKGEAQSPLKTINDLTQVSNQTAESMFGVNIADTQTAAAPVPTQNAESATGASSVAPAVTPTAAVSVSGDAKIAVDMVVTAVNAFKDATAKSIDAANAVKTAAQSKNYSAIMDAKKKVTNATEALKKAKADVTAAINTLNSAGPEAQAAVKAMGIDLSMFGGSAGSSDNADETDGGGEGDGTYFYFTPKYQSPVGSPVSWGGVNAEIGWGWKNGAVFGIDLSFGMDGSGGLIGLGLSLGKEYDFGNQMQFVYGGAAGFWMVGGGYSGESFNFLAPFVKYRVSNYELTYRGLMGINNYTDKFSYNSHQTMVGYHFRGATNKPKRSDSHSSDSRPSDGEDKKGVSENHGSWDKFPPKEAGRGEVKLGGEYGIDQGRKDRNDIELGLGVRYGIANGLEASAVLPIPTAVFIKGCDECGKDYAGLSYPKIGIRYWLPIGLGFFGTARLPIDTREGREDQVALKLDMGTQFSMKFTDEISWGNQIRFSVPFENKRGYRGPMGLNIGTELDVRLGHVTPFIGFDTYFDVTEPAYKGPGSLLYDKTLHFDISCGLIFAITESISADISYNLGISGYKDIHYYYVDAYNGGMMKWEENRYPMAIGAHLSLNF